MFVYPTGDRQYSTYSSQAIAPIFILFVSGDRIDKDRV